MPKVPESHLEARRLQILQAAIVCFARKGVQGTSMQDILRESGLSAGAVYRYFPSKQAIIESTAEQSGKQLQELFAQARAAGGGEALGAMRAFSAATFGRLSDPTAEVGIRASLAFIAEAVRDETVRRHYLEAMETALEGLAELAAKLQQDGRLPQDLDPRYVARVLYALFDGCRIQKGLEPELNVDQLLSTLRHMLVWSSATVED